MADDMTKEDKADADLAARHNAAGLRLIILILNLPIKGWVLSLFWGWFVVPLFGVPPMGVWQALGVILVAMAVFGGDLNGPRLTEEEKNLNTTAKVIWPFFILGLGFIVKQFV